MVTALVEQNVPARMRDGVTLYANVYRPAEPGRYPVLLCRSPYGKDGPPPINLFQAIAAGYVMVIQDCRGTGASEGVFDWFSQLAQEGLDGYDTVEWAAGLPYADGAVGMIGGSYVGWTQHAAAMQHPPHLRAIAPMVTWVDAADGLCYRGGAFELGTDLSWHLGMSVDVVRRKLTAAGASAQEIATAVGSVTAAIDSLSKDGYAETPLRDLQSLRPADLAGIVRNLLDLGPGHLAPEWSVSLAAIDAPALYIGGWYDIFSQATLNSFVGLRSRGLPAQLLIGPWTHGNQTSTIGEMDFGLASSLMAMNPDALQLRWFDRWLKGIDNGVDREPPARVFLTGENRWLELPGWPPAGVQQMALYLQPGGGLGPSAPAAGAGASSYIYDPSHPTPTLGGATLMPGVFPPGVRDQRPLSARPDVLTFAGEPLAGPLAIMGHVTAELWISSSAPDTDFVARLIDVHPDGYMENLCDGILRARYRESLQEPKWLEPGAAYELNIDLWSTAHTFKAGHRVAVQVSSASFPRWDRNWNTKEDPSAATAGQKAQQMIWHDAERASRIVLPVSHT